ncbi:DUF5988 family protein [Plantactinospora endophytica]|uniref:Uncharacterized protein n=1 Tax=Plantactinospora endophytica TaxID=673535 RepID=A0ABQ4E9Q0_9ACTN|nr:DUF5988 family protein [Plantactinospora endophytica]GIG91447.1 hypothetical protein Pen02_63830 [Plantactinospora endophytica]
MDRPEHVEAQLVGGPSDAPATATIGRHDEIDRIKIIHLGGYEHFEREAGTDTTAPVYRWTMRTKIAE